MVMEIKTITFTGKEGEIRDDICPVTFRNWDSANAQLNRWAVKAPKDGSYYKTDFKIIFSDGTEYTGRFDLTYAGGTLQNHMRDHLDFVVNPHRPHITADQAEYLKKLHAPYVEGAKKLLAEVSW